MTSSHELKQFLSAKSLHWLNSIERSFSEDERKQAIFALAQERDASGARTLIELLLMNPLRNTQIYLISALGINAHPRAVEYLIQICLQYDDIPLAQEAILALGNSQSSLACEFLLHTLKKNDSPLRREAMSALSTMPFFVGTQVYIDLLRQPHQHPSLIQYALIALGQTHRSPQALSLIEEFFLLQPEHSAILNAALLAVAHQGDEQSILKINKLETHFRFFAQELKRTSHEHILLRQHLSLTSLYQEFLQTEDDGQWHRVYSLLKNFRWKDFIKLPKNSRGPLSFNKECALRLCLFESKRLSQDLELILQHPLDGNTDYAMLASLLRAHRMADPQSETKIFSSLKQHWSPEALVTLLEQFYDPHFGQEFLLSIILDPASNLPLKMKSLNALIDQSFMNGHEDGAVKKALLQIYQHADLHDSLRARAIRALGDLRVEDADFFAFMAKALKANSNLYPSFYYALSNICHPEASKIILQRLKSLVAFDDKQVEIQTAVKALSHCPLHVDDSDLLEKLISKWPNTSTTTLKLALLKIMASCKIRSLISMVEEELNSSAEAQSCLLAIEASHYHYNDNIQKSLLALLEHPNYSFAKRALHSLCQQNHQSSDLTHKLWTWISNRLEHKDLVLKFLETHTHHKRFHKLEQNLKTLDTWLENKPACFQDPEVWNLALNLRDQMQLQTQRDHQHMSLSHPSDSMIGNQIPFYPHASPLIKTILRNAELTWQNPQIFSEAVDRSTIAVELIKSIDILIQERMRSLLNLNRQSPLLLKMQSHLIQLNFDEPYKKPQDYFETLQCGHSFSLDDFPSHKLSLLCQGIMSGKIIHEPYRIFDSLRAWALVFLVFGRKFSYGGQILHPIFSLRIKDAHSLEKLASELNSLQEVRNRAVHRGELLSYEQIFHIREKSFIILDALDKMLDPEFL